MASWRWAESLQRACFAFLNWKFVAGQEFNGGATEADLETEFQFAYKSHAGRTMGLTT